jgi:hypothetical protein
MRRVPITLTIGTVTGEVGYLEISDNDTEAPALAVARALHAIADAFTAKHDADDAFRGIVLTDFLATAQDTERTWAEIIDTEFPPEDGPATVG